jgi:hypothetical protein
MSVYRGAVAVTAATLLLGLGGLAPAEAAGMFTRIDSAEGGTILTVTVIDVRPDTGRNAVVGAVGMGCEGGGAVLDVSFRDVAAVVPVAAPPVLSVGEGPLPLGAWAATEDGWRLSGEEAAATLAQLHSTVRLAIDPPEGAVGAFPIHLAFAFLGPAMDEMRQRCGL